MRAHFSFIVATICLGLSASSGCAADDVDCGDGTAVTFTGKKCDPGDRCLGTPPDTCSRYIGCMATSPTSMTKVCPIELNPGNECRTGEVAPCMTTAVTGSPSRPGVYMCNACKWTVNMCKPCGRVGEPCCSSTPQCTTGPNRCLDSTVYPLTGACL